MKRASKRLINAIIALVASVILCIGVCLAWFAMNNDVSGNGLQTQVKSGDIVSFNVTAYYLDYSTKNKNYSVVEGNSPLITDASGNQLTIDHNGDSIINSLTSAGTTGDMDVMRPYSVSGGYTTAVLFKVEYEIVDGSEKKFRIFAECNENSRLKVERVGETTNFTSYLSNTVTFVSATQSETASDASTFAESSDTTPDYTYTAESDTTAFIGGVGLREKSFHIGLKDGIEDTNKTDGNNYTDTEYFIMDYEKERFTYISSLLLESGGGLNSALTLTGDISLGIEEYVEGATVTPTSIVVDTDAYNYSTAYKQSMSTVDTMTPNWQFVVTYSDGSQKILVGTNSNLDIKDLITNQVGSRTATVTYKDTSVFCSVPYEIGVVITGGTGVAIGDTLQLTLNTTGLTDPAVVWSSSDERVATVAASEEDSSIAVVNPVSTGTTTITATATVTDAASEASAYALGDSVSTYATTSTTYTATYVITVTSSKVAVESVKLNKSSLSLEVGESTILTASVSPDNATNKAVSWTSDNTSAVTVDQNGRVTAVANGSATITVTTADGSKTASCTVSVVSTVAVESVTISGDTEVAVDGTITLSATVLPANATSTIAWSVIDDTGSASITSAGVLTGVSAGTVTVIAEAGGKSDSYIVTVKGVRLDKTSVALTKGSTATITANVYPTTSTATVSWSTSDGNVATVSGGTVNAVGAGNATITAKATIDGVEYSATCKVTVTAVMYTYTFYDNDGKTVFRTATVAEGTAIEAPSNPTKSGYNFDGWYTAANGGTKVEFGTITATANVSYYAHWTAKTQYTVTFKMNGHGSAIDEQKVYDGEYASEPDEPTATGYTFGGWYKEAGCTNKFDFNTAITANITLYAKWTEDIGAISEAVTFIPKSSTDSRFTVTGSAKSHSAITIDGIAIPENGALKLDSKGSVTFTTAVEMTMTLYLLDSSTVNVNDIAQSVTKVGTYYVYTATIAAGTYTISKGGGENTLYAIKLTPTSGSTTTKYTVTFDANGKTATGMPDSQSIESGGKVTAPETNPTATGYEFDGWYKDSDCTTVFDFDTETISSDTTIYAHWTASGVEYTATGTYQLDVAGGGSNAASIFTWSLADGADGGFGTSTDGTKRFKLTSNKDTGVYDYLYINTTLAAGATINISGVLRSSTSTSTCTLGISLHSDSKGTVSGIGDPIVYSGTGIAISRTITVETAGIIKLELKRNSTVTGCELLNLYVGINETPTVPVSSVTVSGDDTVVAGKTITLSATVLPLNATNRTVTWAIKSGSEYAEINSSTGVLTGKAQGSVTITATAGGVTSADFGVTVNAAVPTEIKLNSGTTTFKKGSSNPTSDWVFIATYSDGTSKDVTESISLSDTVSTSTVGNSYSVTASYTENEVTKECTVSYKVIEPSTIVYINGTGTTSFTQGSTASTDGWQFTVTYSDDSTTATITADDTRLSIGEISTTTTIENGSVAVTFTECDKTVECNVSYTVTAAGTGTTTTYTYTNNGTIDNPGENWSYANATTNNYTLEGGVETKYARIKANSGTLTLTCSGSKATITLKGFKGDTSNELSIKVVAYKGNVEVGTVVATIAGSQKVELEIINAGVIEGEFDKIVISGNTSTSPKYIIITSAVVVVE